MSQGVGQGMGQGMSQGMGRLWRVEAPLQLKSLNACLARGHMEIHMKLSTGINKSRLKSNEFAVTPLASTPFVHL